jgi:hypothetical protein
MSRVPSEEDGVELEVEEVKAVTAKALLIVVDGAEYWLPKSQTHEDSELDGDAEKGDEGIVTVTSWWAEKEGLS